MRYELATGLQSFAFFGSLALELGRERVECGVQPLKAQ